MHYYVFSALVFNNRKIRDAYNLMHRSEQPCTIMDFRRKVALEYAGTPDTYSAIIIGSWQELDEATFNQIGSEMEQLNKNMD